MHKDAPGPSIPDFEPAAHAAGLRPQVAADPALASEAVALAASVLNMEYAALLELPPSGKAFLLAKGVGWKTELIGTATLSAENDGLWGFTLAADQSVCVEDAQTEHRFRWPAFLLDHQARSGVTVIG